MSQNIRDIILQEIKREGAERFAAAWGFTVKQVKTAQRTKKPSAAMLEKAFEFMQQSQDQEPAAEEHPAPRPRRQAQPPAEQTPARTPRPQPFRRAPGTAPMFTDPDGADHPTSTVRPGVLQQPPGAPFIVPPNSMPGFVPARHPGISLGQQQLHQPQFQQNQGVIVPAGIDPSMWMMFLQFMQMMGNPVAGMTEEIALPGGNVMESMADPGYGHNWNIPYGKQPAK